MERGRGHLLDTSPITRLEWSEREGIRPINLTGYISGAVWIDQSLLKRRNRPIELSALNFELIFSLWKRLLQNSGC